MQTVPRPDIDELISGGRELRHRRNRGRVAVAAAVAVLLAGGAYGVTLIDTTTKAAPPADTSKPSRSADPQSLPMRGGSDIEPGTYRMLVGVDATGATLEADLTLDGVGWTDGNYPVVSDGTHTAGVAVYRPQTLAAGSGCDGDEPRRDVAETAPALAQQLAQLPRSTVVQAATQQRAFGRDTVHLRLRIDDRCSPDAYRVADAPRGSRGVSYSDELTDVVIDFWVVDVDGAPVVVDAWHQDGTPSELVDQIDRTRKSVTFTTGQ